MKKNLSRYSGQLEDFLTVSVAITDLESIWEDLVTYADTRKWQMRSLRNSLILRGRIL